MNSPHSVRFDAQGNVWISDFAGQAIRKFTPDGKRLLTLGTLGKSGEDECGTHLDCRPGPHLRQ